MRLLFVLLMITVAFAELPSSEVSKGNKAAKSGQTDQAQYHYVKALENHADTSTVMYNLGNAMYDAGEFERAMKIYSGAIDSTRTPEQLERAYYNMGNASFQAQKFDKAIASYIEALRHDPSDADAKQNLELALRMKKKSEEQQQQNQDQSKQDQQDKQDQQQNQQNQDQQKQDTQKQDEQLQQQQNNQQQQGDSSQAQQGQQQQPQQMSKEEAEQLLNALLQDEQNTLEQVRKVKMAQRKKRTKDW